MTITAQPTCAERVQDALKSRISDIRIMWRADCEGIEDAYDLSWDEFHEEHPDWSYGDFIDLRSLPPFHEYGLAFDYVAPYTFTDQTEGYFRYQLSFGGPSEEFRFYVSPSARGSYTPHRIEFWFLDWFDGAPITLQQGSDAYALMREIFERFDECGITQAEVAKATED